MTRHVIKLIVKVTIAIAHATTHVTWQVLGVIRIVAYVVVVKHTLQFLVLFNHLPSSFMVCWWVWLIMALGTKDFYSIFWGKWTNNHPQEDLTIYLARGQRQKWNFFKLHSVMAAYKNLWFESIEFHSFSSKCDNFRPLISFSKKTFG